MTAAFHGRVDDIGRVCPFVVWLDAITADARGIEQILDVVVEALCFVAHVMDKCSQLLFFLQCRGCAKHRGGAKDRSERRAQLVADGSEQRLTQLIGLRTHACLANSVSDAEPFKRCSRVREHSINANTQLIGAFLRFMAKIDRDDSEFEALRGYLAN